MGLFDTGVFFHILALVSSVFLSDFDWLVWAYLIFARGALDLRLYGDFLESVLDR